MKNSLRNNNIKLIFKALACFVFAIISIFGVMLLCQPTKSENEAVGKNNYSYSTAQNTSTAKYINSSFIYKVYSKYNSSNYNNTYYNSNVKTIKFTKTPTSYVSEENIYKNTNKDDGFGRYYSNGTLYVWFGTRESQLNSYTYNTTTKEYDWNYTGITTIYTNINITNPTKLFCNSGSSTLFSSCTTIDFSEVTFSTEKMNTSYMFAYLPSLTTIKFPSSITNGLTKIKTNNMSSMFLQDASLTGFSFLTYFDTSNVTDMSSMFAMSKYDDYKSFSKISKATELDLSSFDTSSVTNMSGMFAGMENLTKLTFGSNFETASVADMSAMFLFCASLTELNLTNFDTSSVRNMSNMFYVRPFFDVDAYGNPLIGKLNRIIVNKDNFNTKLVQNMSYMFNGCALTSFNGEDKDNDGIADINVNNFDISNLENMSNMFSMCIKVSKIDISNIASQSKSSKINNVDGLFGGCFQYGTITAISDVVVGLNNFEPPNVSSMNYFFDCWNLGTNFYQIINKNTVPLLFQSSIEDINYLFRECDDIWSETTKTDETTKKEYYVFYENVTNMFKTGGKEFNSYESIEGLFQGVGSIKSLIGIDKLDTSNVSSLRYFFDGTGIENLDGIGSMKLNSGNLNISGMFQNCTFLKKGLKDTTSVLNFGARNITAKNLFSSCGMSDLSVLDAFNFSNCTSIDLSYAFAYTNITTKINDTEGKTKQYVLGGKVTLSYLFYYSNNTSGSLEALGNIKITTVYGSYPKVDYMFSGASRYNLNGLYYFFETNSNLQNLDWMFCNCYLTNSTDTKATSAYSLSEVTSANYMFYNCSSLTSLSSNFNEMFKKLKNGISMFCWCSNLSSISFNEGDFASLTNGSNMFYYCYNLKGDLFKKTTFPALTNGSCMFYNCDNLLDTRTTSSIFSGDEMFPALTNASYMFYDCDYLTSLKDFNITGKIEDMSYMFYSCDTLTSLDGLENLNCGNISNLNYILKDCTALTDATAFTNHNFPKTITSFNYAFYNCSKLEILDLSNMMLGNNNSSALSDCSALKILIAPSFSYSSYSLSLPTTMYNVDGDGTGKNSVSSSDAGKEFSTFRLTVTFSDEKNQIPDGEGKTGTKQTYVYSRLLKNAEGEYVKDENGRFQFDNQTLEVPTMPNTIEYSGNYYIFNDWSLSDSSYGPISEEKLTFLGETLRTKSGTTTLTLTAQWEKINNLVNLLVKDEKYQDFLIFKDESGNEISVFGAKKNGQTLTITLSTPTSENNYLVATLTYGIGGTVDTYYVYQNRPYNVDWTSVVTYNMYNVTDTSYSTNLISSTSYKFTDTSLDVNLVFDIAPTYKITYVLGTTDSDGYAFINDSTPTFVSGMGEKDHVFLTEFGSLPEVNNFTGYTFVGWFTDNTWSTQITSTSTFDEGINRADLTFYAKFDIKKYNLNFNVNDSSLGYFSETSLSDITYGSTISRNDKTLTITEKRQKTGVASQEYTVTLMFENIIGHNVNVVTWAWSAGTAFGNSNDIPDIGVTGSTLTINVTLSKSPIRIKITLDCNSHDIDNISLVGGNVAQISKTEFSVNYGETFSQLESPTLIGYTFKGWNTSANGWGEEITSSMTVLFEEDTTIFAQWEINKWKITINVNNSEIGSVEEKASNEEKDSIIYENISYYTEISVNGNEISIGGKNFPVVANIKEKRGYIIEFVEWQENGSTLTRTNLGDANLTITAKFSQEARVTKFTFNVNDKDSENEALINTPASIADKNITYGTSYTLDNPTLTGYTFQGWYFADGAKVEQSGVSDFVFDGDQVTVYAKWDIKKFKIVISASDNSKAIPTVTEIVDVKYNTAVSISASDEKDITVGSQNIRLAPQGNYALHDGKTLDVVWKINGATFTNQTNVPDSTGDAIQIYAILTGKTVNVTLSCKDKDNYNEDLILNGATLPTYDIQLVYGSTYAISSYQPSLTGYNFAGWHNANGDEINVTDEVIVNPAETLSVIAYFDIKEYDLTINVTGDDVKKLAGTDVAGIEIITKKAGKLEYVNNGNASEDTDAQLVIHNIKHFTTLNVENNVITFSSGAVLTAQARSEEFKGYTITFNGWQNVTNGQMIENNLSFTVNFSAVGNKYTITFTSNGGEIEGSEETKYTKEVTYGQSFTTLTNAAFVREGFVFDSWSTNPTTKEGWTEFETTYTYYVADDSTIYAYWVSILLNINIVVSDESLGTINSTTSIQIKDVVYGTELVASGMTLTINTDEPINILAEINRDYNRTGYTIVFKGYSADDEYIESITLRKELDIFAVFVEQANSYQLYYSYKDKDSNGKVLIGTPTNSKDEDAGEGKTIVFDQIYGTVPTLKLAGYDFKGWYLNNTYTQEFNTSAIHTQPNNLTIYAKWEIHVYTVSFELDENLASYSNNTGKLSKEYEYGTRIAPNGEKLIVTKRGVSGSTTETISFNRKVWTGYDIKFVDFVLNGSTTISTSLTFDDEKVKNGVISIRAILNKVAQKFTVTFVGGTVDNDGETLIGEPTIKGSKSIEVTYDSKYEDGGNMPNIELPGYTFAGWKLSNGDVIISSDVVKITQSQNLIATWNIKYYQVNVRVNNDNYGQVDNTISQSYKYNTQIVINDNQLSVLSQTSKAIATEVTGYDTVFSHFERKGKTLSTFNIIDDGDLEIIAVFERTAKKYRIIYNINTINEEKGYAVDAEGYAMLETPAFISGQSLIDGNKREYTYDSTYSSLAEASVKGYTFAGWYFDKGHTQRLEADSIVKILGETNVYAKWIINKFYITASVFDENLGTTSQETIRAKYKSTVRIDGNMITAGNLQLIAQPTEKKGYTTEFVKWTNYSGKEIPSEFVIQQNLEVIAVFDRHVNTYKVSYYADGIDISFASKDIQFDTKYGDLPLVADREGYDKGDWYLDSNYKTKVTEQTTMQTDANHTLYFKWIIQKYDINFVIVNEDLGSLDSFYLVDVEYNTAINVDGNTLLIGNHKIKGLPTLVAGYDVSVEYWAINGEKITETTLKRPSTIEVKFIKNALSFTVTFETKTKDTNGGKISGQPELNGEQTKTITYDSSYGEMPVPTLEGYVFAGWYSDENFTKKIDESTIVKTARDHKIYAKWIKTMSSNSIGTIIIVAVGIVAFITVIGIVVGVKIKKDKEKDYFDMGV